ncbi:MAG: hypothetical protein K0S41_665 [Anaerocolumna sp.]|jgi:hypothetical protein|nr:hypothetical protein [Anaerocolumna sp.]
MKFIKLKNEFPSYIHKVIYLHALRQTPLEVSLKDTTGINQ